MLWKLFYQKWLWYIHAKTCTQLFIAALFIIAKKWEHPKYPLTDQWISKIWYTHIMECYSEIKWSEVLTHDVMR